MPLAPPLSLAADAADGVRVFKVSRSMRRPKRSHRQPQPSMFCSSGRDGGGGGWPSEPSFAIAVVAVSSHTVSLPKEEFRLKLAKGEERHNNPAGSGLKI